MMRFALIGDPVDHSLSPVMHAAAYKALGLDAAYERRRVVKGGVSAAMRELWDEGFQGFNITVPHKLEVMESLSFIDAKAQAVGAVNTVLRRDDGWHGTNTDAEGFVRSLPEPPSSYQRALVLGAGGAARAVAYGLTQAGVEVHVSARREGAAESLREVGAVTALWPPSLDAPLVINATSASWHHGEAFVKSLPWTKTQGLFVDLAYGIPLRFLAQAEAHGAATLDGLGMLVHQGALAFEAWTGQSAPVNVMRAALVGALEERSAT
jgi:shikimate dehydrogenase